MTGLTFEFFPPKSPKGRARLDDTMRSLSRYAPIYVSVTYGAGGSTADGTLETLDRLRTRRNVTTAAHLCYSGVPKERTDAYAKSLWNSGHRRLVALRGDAEAVGSEGVDGVPAFVRELRSCHPFDIAVACYPEVHPMAASPEDDLDVLLAKQEAGATHAISQFFFDAELFLGFVDRARTHGITIPIVPGILPIHDIERAIEFGDKCGSPVPQWVRDEFLHAGRDGRDDMAVSDQLIRTLVHELCAAGVPDLHIYTLNRAELTDVAAETYRDFYPVARAA